GGKAALHLGEHDHLLPSSMLDNGVVLEFSVLTGSQRDDLSSSNTAKYVRLRMEGRAGMGGERRRERERKEREREREKGEREAVWRVGMSLRVSPLRLAAHSQRILSDVNLREGTSVSI